jgi:hypothetical protein
MMMIFFRRSQNLDVEIAASGFTKEMEKTFEEVNVLTSNKAFIMHKSCIYKSLSRGRGGESVF